MAIIYPLALSALADRLPIESVTWDVHRLDELSGTGDGSVWQAEIAPPKWSGEVQLHEAYHEDLKQIAATIRKLHGAQESFFLFDPLSKYPQADPEGSILGSATVLVHTVATATLRLKGLPAGYVLTLGDKGQIAFASNPVRNYFFEVSETVTADGSGVTAAFHVFPHVPPGVAADQAVILKKPACKVFIMPGTFNPGVAQGMTTTGAGFKVMERKR